MCIPPLIKFYIIKSLILVLIILVLFEMIKIELIFLVLIAIPLIFIGNFFSRCPKCKLHIGSNVHGIVSYSFTFYCKRCGQDLRKCRIENDSEIKKRNKNKS